MILLQKLQGDEMGCSYQVKCCDCEAEFMVDEGGGMSFQLLRCDQCGDIKWVSFDELGELHLRYLKGLSGPYCIASAEYDREVREYAPMEPITEEEYHAGIEAMMKPCECGGKLTFNAPARCPECRSTKFEEIDGGSCICYD
jgi:predicted Zn-ribbon and HTH transcriptional regulator